MVDDSLEVFLHFRSAGWEAIEPAIAKSAKVKDFFDVDLATGFIPDLLTSSHVPTEVRETIIDNLDKFVPDDDEPALRAAATYARSKRHSLPVNQLRRVAAVTRKPSTVVSLLAISPPSGVTSSMFLLNCQSRTAISRRGPRRSSRCLTTKTFRHFWAF